MKKLTKNQIIVASLSLLTSITVGAVFWFNQSKPVKAEQPTTIKTSKVFEIGDTVLTEAELSAPEINLQELVTPPATTVDETSVETTEAQPVVVENTTQAETPVEETPIVDEGSPYLYSLADLQFHGVIHWGGYKYTFYSQQVLPGGGLQIPGRHVNHLGYVADENGYIVVASDKPKGTIVPTPFGMPGKVYDAGVTGNHIDIYTQ